MATLPKASTAVTVRGCATPAVVVAGNELTSALAAAAFTLPVALAVRTGLLVSATDRVWLPLVFSVSVKMWTPASAPLNV